MAIEFGCTSCGQMVRVADSAAGKKGKCPHCGTVLTIPGGSPEPAAAAGAAARVPQGPSAPTASVQSVSFPCPGCGRTMKAPAAMSGKRGKCPHCQTLFVIGGGSAGGAPSAVQPTQPASDFGGLTPLGDMGLAPLGGGLTPLGGQPGLDPLAGLAALPPAKPLPGSSPFGQPSPWGQQATSPLGIPAGNPYAPNPYATSTYAPVPGGYAPSGVAPAKLMVPAICLLLIAVLAIGYWSVSFIIFLGTPLPAQFQGNDAEALGGRFGYYAAGFGVNVAGGLVNLAVLAGAVQMIRLRTWSLARAAAAAAIIPCCGGCVSMPIGIWALVILNQPDIKRQFR